MFLIYYVYMCIVNIEKFMFKTYDNYQSYPAFFHEYVYKSNNAFGVRKYQG